MPEITEAECQSEAVQHLHRKTPYLIAGVSGSMCSIARYYGGAIVKGEFYLYQPESDTLVRRDVVKVVMKQRKKWSAGNQTDKTFQNGISNTIRKISESRKHHSNDN